MKYLKKFEDLVDFMIQMDFIERCIKLFGENDILYINEYIINYEFNQLGDESYIVDVKIKYSEYRNIKTKNVFVDLKVKIRKDSDSLTSISDILNNRSQEFVDSIEKLIREKLTSYEFQKEFLTEYPEKYKDLIPFKYAKGIKKEFSYIFNAEDMGLL